MEKCVICLRFAQRAETGSGIDLSDGNGQFFPVFDFVDAAVANPDDLIRYVEHLDVMGGRDNGDTAFPAELFQQINDFFTRV